MSLFMCHYSHKPGTVFFFNSPKNRTVGCPWAAHSPNVGSSWWNRIPYPLPVSYSPKHNLLSRTAQMDSKNSPKISTIRSQVFRLIKRPFKASNQPKHYKTLKQSVTSSRIKLLPHGVCQKLPKPVPTCSPRCVEPLCFLVRRNPTVRLPRILERRYSLSKRKITKWLLHLHSSFHAFFSFFISLPFSYEFFSFVYIPSFCFSFLFLISLLIPFQFLPISSFLFAFLSFFFGALTVWVKRRKFPPPFLKPNVWLSHFHSFYFIS